MLKKYFMFLIFICFCFFNLFAFDFSSIKAGESKTDIISRFGKPIKSIKESRTEFCIWEDSDEIWVISFTNEISDGEALKIEEFFKFFIEFGNIFSELNENEKTLIKKQDMKIDKTILDEIDINILECRIFNKNYDPSVGYRLKVKNRSNKEISKLSIVLYFYDKNGEIFFEKKSNLIDSDSYTGAKILKPNYSILIPESSGMIRTIEGIDIDEWDEGNVSFEIEELK